jgi:D-glycero-D-manno-heptose 1,7-bisphosphate phosphatase
MEAVPERPGASSGGKALFLDRDGTLIFDRHYLSDPEGVELIPGVAEALRRAIGMGYLLFLFSNQSGVGRGYFTMKEVGAVNRRMEELLDLPPPGFTAVGIAPEAPWEPAVYRKPSPRFIREMIALHRLDPEATFMIGDGAGDVEAGLGAGVRSVAVATGKGPPPSELEVVRRENVAVYPDLATFVDWLAGRGP